MDRLRRVVNNTVISLAGQMVSWTSTLLLTIAYGRFLGDLKFGELYFATTFVLLIGTPIALGFDQQITRDVSQKPQLARRYLSSALLIKISLWFVLYLLIMLLCWILGYSPEVRNLVAICGLTLLSTAITSTFASLHFSFERVVFSAIGTIIENGLSALFGFFLLKNGAGVEVMAFVLLGGSIANGIWQAIWVFRLQGFGFVLDKSIIRELMHKSIPFIAFGIMGVLYYRVDTVLLSLMTNDNVVGWYGAGYRLFDTLCFLPSLVISTIMYPVFSKLSVISQANLKLAVEKTTNFLLFFGIPLTTAMIVVAPNIIGFLYHGADFNNAVPVLQALAPGLTFLYLNWVLGATLVSMKQEKIAPRMAFAALIFNLGMNLIFIPLYKEVAAAAITSLTELLLFAIYITITFPRNLLPLGSIRVAIKAIIASLVMALIIWLLNSFTILIIVPIGTIIYLGTAMLLGTIPREDILALYRAVKHKGQRLAERSPDQEEKESVSPDLFFADKETLLVPAVFAAEHQTPRSTSAPRRTHLNRIPETPAVDRASSYADRETLPLPTVNERDTGEYSNQHPIPPSGTIHLDHIAETPATGTPLPYADEVTLPMPTVKKYQD